jgi:hypothetical protein
MAKKLKLTLVAFSLMTLSACSLTYPAVGTVTKTGETFSGTAKSSMSKGELYMTTNTGVTCEGVYLPPKVSTVYDIVSMSGNVVCSDGRIGSWNATGSLNDGFKGVGKIDGETFNFYAGDAIPG